MKTIYIIRHGETEANKKGIFRGRLDIELSKRGKEQAEELKKYFKDIEIDYVLSSPLKRAYETSKIAFPDKSIKIEKLLNNLDLGDWSGKEKALIKEREPELWSMWVNEPEKIQFPNGESLSDVYERLNTLKDKLEKLEFNSIALVTHRSIIKVFFAVILGIKENYFWKFHIDNCSVSTIVFDIKRGFTITKLNDTSHISKKVTEWF